MIALLCFFLTLLASLFKSKSRLEVENAALRRQLIMLRRRVRGRVQLTNGDRLFLVQLYRWVPNKSFGRIAELNVGPDRRRLATTDNWWETVLWLTPSITKS
jgi:hypothetical protein